MWQNSGVGPVGGRVIAAPSDVSPSYSSSKGVATQASCERFSWPGDSRYHSGQESAIEGSRLVEWVKKAFKESHKDEVEYHKKGSLGELNQRYEQIQRRLDLLYNDKVDGKIAKEFYERKFRQYTEEKEMVIESIRQHNAGQTKYFELGMSILELAQKAKEIYLNRSVEEKRQLLALTFSNLALKDGNLYPVYHSALQLIAERVKTGELLRW